jgi:hypothetical protein
MCKIEGCYLDEAASSLSGPTMNAGDAAMLLQQAGPAAFIAFASNADYLAGIGHRAAALEDPRLLRRRESGW